MRLSKSSLNEAERSAVRQVLEKEYLGMGAEVNLFEAELAAYLSLPQSSVCVVNSGTSALQLALEALDIGVGCEVLVPSLTFVASCQAILATGAMPVLCEVDAETLFIDVTDAENRITKKTRAIMPVHYASSTDGMNEIYKLAQKHEIRVVEDAAHSFGGNIENSLVGQIGDLVCFSFDGIKNVTSGEGGAVVCHDPDLVERLKDGRLLGVMKDSEKRAQGERSWDFDVQKRGFRFHMSDIMAAIGRVQLGKLENTATIRRKLVHRYLAGFQAIPGVEPLPLDYANLVPHIFVARIHNGKRDHVFDQLQKAGIGCGIHYKPNHLLSLFKTDYSLPVTELAYGEIISLPLHNDLVESDIDQVVQAVQRALTE